MADVETVRSIVRSSMEKASESKTELGMAYHTAHATNVVLLAILEEMKMLRQALAQKP
jgi:hypothetical protein